jgi:mRNA interferase HigB
LKIQLWQRAHDFCLRHPGARQSLIWWRGVVSQAQWRNFTDVKKTFGHLADIYEDDWWIFDIHNNAYRLIAIIEFDGQQIWIRRILTHKEYASTD